MRITESLAPPQERSGLERKETHRMR